MKCPHCGGTESRVKDSRDIGDAIHRRRECEQCKGRFSTYERVEKSQLMIAKRDLRREPFDRQKLFVGISKACEKRPLAVADDGEWRPGGRRTPAIRRRRERLRRSRHIRPWPATIVVLAAAISACHQKWIACGARGNHRVDAVRLAHAAEILDGSAGTVGPNHRRTIQSKLRRISS